MNIELRKICKALIVVFLVYVLWYKYAFGNNAIVLYCTIFLSTSIMICDLTKQRFDLSKTIPTGVWMNLVMCIYSISVGVFGVKSVETLVSGIKTYAAFTLICITICYVSRDGIDWLMDALIAIGILCCVYTLAFGYYRKQYGLVIGPDQNPNNLGLNLNICLFAVAYRCRKNSRTVLFGVIIASLFVYTIAGCGSRKCLIAAAIMLVLWLFPLFRITWHDASSVGKICLVLLFLVILVASIKFYQLVYISSDAYHRMSQMGKEDSSTQRIEFYRYALQYFLERPIFGIGYAQFGFWRNGYYGYSHSVYAETIAAWGMVGTVLYFTPIFTAGIRIVKKMKGQGLNNEKYLWRVLMALWCMEVFLGVGQIYYYEIEHMIAWTIVYLLIDHDLFLMKNDSSSLTVPYSRYIR